MDRREDVSNARDAARFVKVAVLKSAEGKLNANQQTLVDALSAAGGKLPVETLRTLEIPRSTLSTLVRRGVIELADEPADFTISGLTNGAPPSTSSSIPSNAGL